MVPPFSLLDLDFVVALDFLDLLASICDKHLGGRILIVRIFGIACIISFFSSFVQVEACWNPVLL